MSQIEPKTKLKNKSEVVVAVAVLAIVVMIFTMGTPYVNSVQDVQAKNGHALDLPIKTEECKHEVVNGPSCKDTENAPDNPGLCPEGWIPATPPLNPQLGCLPGSIAADLGSQPDEDEREEAIQSDDESINVGDEDRSSTLSAGSADRESSKDEGEEDEGGKEDDNGRDDTRGEEQ
jgi:hypothetical protein